MDIPLRRLLNPGFWMMERYEEENPPMPPYGYVPVNDLANEEVLNEGYEEKALPLYDWKAFWEKSDDRPNEP